MLSVATGSDCYARRVRLPTKLFLAIAAPCVALAVVTAVATVRSFDRGFETYVAARQRDALEAVAVALGDYYAEHRTWSELANDRRAWRRLLAPILRAEPELETATTAPIADPPPISPAAGPASGRRWRRGGPGVTPTRLRVAIYDHAGALVAGRIDLPPTTPRAEITVDDRVVGSVAVGFGQAEIDPVDRAFARQQRRLIWGVLGASLALAAVLAWYLARGILRPVRAMAGASRAMARGAYDISIPTSGRDELAQLAADINHLATALAAQQTTRQNLLADLAHELRTPLAILQSELEALADGVRAWSTTAAESLRGEVLGLTKLVDDIRLLSLADVGALPLATQPTALTSLVTDALARFATALAARDITVQPQDFAAPTLSGAEVNADAEQLGRVLTNLLQNVVRYTKRGGHLWVAIEATQAAVACSLEDDGPGVPSTELPHLFDRFYQANHPSAGVAQAHARQHAGSGIGLALCKAIVERHGGAIHAYASQHGGLGVSFSLPRHPPYPRTPPP